MSTLAVGTIKSVSSAAPVFQNTSGTEKGQLAKIWCSWNGIGTVSIYDSFGVSSVTDNGTGDFILNFSNNMSNTNYAFTWASGGLIWNGLQDYRTTSTLRCLAMSRTDAPYTQDDSNINCIAIFGDQ
mgnify:CR=1 FL=1